MNNLENIKNFYQDYTYKNQPDYIQKTIKRNILDHEINDKKILDYGCGVGEFTFYISKNYSPMFIMGIDFSKKSIEKAKYIKKKKE